MQIKGEKVDSVPLIEVVCTVLSKKRSGQCLVCLEVVSTLLDVQGAAVIENEHLRSALLDTLKEEDDDVIDCDLKVLVKYVNISQRLEPLIKRIVDVRFCARTDA